MKPAALLGLLLALAACAGDAPSREGWRPVSGPTLSIGGSVGGFAGVTR